MNKVPITVNGAKILQEELTQLKTVGRPRVNEAIADASAHGDWRANAE